MDNMTEKFSVLVSVIIPVYNTQKKLLNQCIESLATQTYTNIEIIIVNDGSVKEYTDVLDNLAKHYRKKDCDIKIVHKKLRGGVSAARNSGIKIAKGKWFCFVDSDDYVHERYIEYLLKKAIDTEADCVACNFARIDYEKKILSSTTNLSGDWHDAKIWKNVNTGFIWNKIFSRSIIGEIRFKEGMSLCEDLLFLNQILERCRRCVQIDLVLYFHLVNPYSVTSWLSEQQYAEAIEAVTYMNSIECIQQDFELLKNQQIYLGEWIVKYIDMIIAEKNDGWIQRYKRQRNEFIKNVIPYIDSDTNKIVKISSFVLRLPYIIGIIYFKIFHLIRIRRLIKRRKDSDKN